VKPNFSNLTIAFVLMFVSSGISFAATVRGKLVCDGGRAPATGIAVNVSSPKHGRSAPFFTGGDGMYYLNNIPAGKHVLEVWLSKQGKTPNYTYNIDVHESITDIPQLVMPVCYPQ